MSNLVYLITSLPSLTFGQVPPISIDEFINDAKSQLSARHFKLLEFVDIQKMDAASGLKSLFSVLSEMQHDLSELRKAKAQNREPNLARLPKSVLAGNPLEREKLIMQYQWEELDSIESGKTFTMTEVLVYKLKLQILSRMESFSPEHGAQVLDSVINPSKKEEDKLWQA